MKKNEIEIKGQRMFGAVAQDGPTTWFSLNGEVWTVETASAGRSARGKSKSSTTDPSQVRAPMPGKIIKIVSSVGTSVNLGDTLIVMEAMKMEYTLKAAAPGTVEEISCEVGQQVTPGPVAGGAPALQKPRRPQDQRSGAHRRDVARAQCQPPDMRQEIGIERCVGRGKATGDTDDVTGGNIGQFGRAAKDHAAFGLDFAALCRSDDGPRPR